MEDGHAADANMQLQVLRYAQATESGQGTKPRAEAKSHVTAEEIDTTFWNTVKDSSDPALLEAYLDRFPNGHFAPLARRQLKKLKPGPTVQPRAEIDPQAVALRERVFSSVVQISVIRQASADDQPAQSEITSQLPDALKGSPFESDFHKFLKDELDSAARDKPTV